MSYETVKSSGVPIKAWTRGVPFEEVAKRQVQQTAELPIVWPHVAIMPDVHLGIGATVGSVVPTRKAIIPAAVGVDIGCGMMALKTSLVASDLPDNLHDVYVALCRAAPHGGAKGKPEVGAWGDSAPVTVAESWGILAPAYRAIVDKYPEVDTKSPMKQLGTMGGGNHFLEVCLDENQAVWVMLHSGSRGVGNRIGCFFIEQAKEEMLKLDRQLPNKDLAYFEEGTYGFADYVQAVMWAQKYARLNRSVMMHTALAALTKAIRPFEFLEGAVNCHHNYVSLEHHFGEKLYITRKGAVSAKVGELGIIPGSMGTKSYIVKGKGNTDSFHSCSHGAGRVMPRGLAKKTITLEQHAEDTKGVECGKDARVLDESPRAYKRVEDVMAAQADLVEIVATLKQVLCVKG